MVYKVFCIPVIATNFDATTCQLQKTLQVEVIGEKNSVQDVKFCNITKLPTLSSLQKLKLENGINEIVFCHVENDTYYCHPNSYINRLAIMSESLQSCSKQKTSSVASVNNVVCAKSMDGCWYRGSVLSFNNNFYEILFVDYGNTETVTSANVMLLPEKFQNIPIFSIPVKISNLNKVKQVSLNSVLSVKTVGLLADNIQSIELVLPKTDLPKASTLKKEILPRETEIELTMCYLEGDIFYGHMKSVHELIKALESKLLKASEFTDLTGLPEVGDLLCAKFTDGIWYRGSVEKICDDKSCLISFVDYGNAEIISIENMKVLPLSLCSFPVFSLPMKLRNAEVLQEQLEAGLSLYKVKVIDVSDGIYIVEVLSPKTELPILKSQDLPLVPTEVIVCHKEESVYFVQKCSDLEALAKMMTDLQNPESRKNSIHSPQIGEILSVKFQDGLFYRGIIREKCHNDSYKVFFVDYGNTDLVKVSDMFDLSSNYFTFSMFCLPVELNRPVLVNPLQIDCQYLVKYSGKMHEDIYVVNVCPKTPLIELSSMKTSSLADSAEVCVLSFDGEFHFVRQLSDSSEFDKMETMLKNFSGEKIIHLASVNEVLLVKCKDNIWRRGCVKESNETLGCYKMFLVDLGTVEDVFTGDVCYVSKQLASFPIFSSKVKMNSASLSILLGMCYEVCIINRTEENIPIVNVIQRCMLASLQRQFLPLHESKKVILFHKEQDTLFVLGTNDLKCLEAVQAEVAKCAAVETLSYNPVNGELLCAQSVMDGSWYRGCVAETISSDAYRIHFIDYGNSEIISKEKLRPVSDKLQQYPSLSIGIKIEGLTSGAEMALEEIFTVIAVSEPSNNIQLVKLEVPKNITDDLSKVGNEICTVSSVNLNSDSSSKFYFSNCKYVPFSSGEQEVIIYHIGESCYVFCAPFNQENITSNIHLTSQVTEFCNNLNCAQYNGSSPPEVDELVLAKYEEDKQWYRAVVVEKNPSDYDVIFVDYGNSEKLHIDSLRRMERQFMSLDIQAHLCLLTGFTVDDVNLPAVMQELKNFTMIPLKAEVNTSGEDMTLRITSITTHLVEKKLVRALN